MRGLRFRNTGQFFSMPLRRFKSNIQKTTLQTMCNEESGFNMKHRVNILVFDGKLDKYYVNNQEYDFEKFKRWLKWHNKVSIRIEETGIGGYQNIKKNNEKVK